MSGRSGRSERDGRRGRQTNRKSTDRRSANRPIPPPPDRSAKGRPPTSDAEGGSPELDPGPREPVVFERVPDDPDGRPRRGSGPSSAQRKRGGKPPIDTTKVQFHGVASATAAKLRRRLAEAASAFAAERFGDAERMLQSISKLAPDVPEVHELLGLTYYRLGRWVKAQRELERFAELTGSVEQHPVLADCARALRQWNRAEDLWQELGQSSPAPELIEEGRIVQAGALADRHRLDDAIRFMERAPKVKGKPATHHLRRWYMLADLYERAGDNARARRLFGDIVRASPDFGDAAERAVAG